MVDRPMMFSAPMIRALLDGRKTQTRRVLKLQPIPFAVDDAGTLCEVGCLHVEGETVPRITLGRVVTLQKVPYAIGDRLWVRETHQFAMSADGPCVLLRGTGSRWSPEWSGPDEGAGASYDYDRCPGDYSHWAADVESADRPWRPAIHMPRWASRLTLIVTDVRVERLQEISHEDAAAEGLIAERTPGGILTNFVTGEAKLLTRIQWQGSAELPLRGMERRAFQDLWASIHGADAWSANPWVVAVSFTVHRANIDAIPADALDIAGAA